MKYFTSIFFLCIIITLFNCKKTENHPPELPPATHVGADFLACKINGKIFISKGAGGKFNQMGPGVVYIVAGDSTIYIDATTLNPHFEVTINSVYKFDLSTYQFGENHFKSGGEYDDDTNGTIPTGINQFNTDKAHSGSVTITYYDGNILAGTFAFDAVNGNDSVVHITEGRFDIQNH